MAGYQQTIIIGHVGTDIQFRYTPSGQAVCNFAVAVNESWTDRNSNEKREKTTWYRIYAWRGLAETCHKYVHKGMQIQVVGTVEANAYISDSGQAVASLELTARDILFLSSRSNNGAGQSTHDEYGSLATTPETDIPF